MGTRPWWGHPMELQPRTAAVIAQQAQPPSLDRLGPLEPRFGNSVQAITFQRLGSREPPRVDGGAWACHPSVHPYAPQRRWRNETLQAGLKSSDAALEERGQ